jgi:hypothetical protein
MADIALGLIVLAAGALVWIVWTSWLKGYRPGIK